MFNEQQESLTRTITADYWNHSGRLLGRWRSNRHTMRQSINSEISQRADEFGIGIPVLIWWFVKPFVIKKAKQLAWDLLCHYIERKLFGGVKSGGDFQSDEPVGR